MGGSQKIASLALSSAGRAGIYLYIRLSPSKGGQIVVWQSHQVAACPRNRPRTGTCFVWADERDVGDGGAGLQGSTDSDLPDASESVPRLPSVSQQHTQGPQSKI